MKKTLLLGMVLVAAVFMTSGCVVRTYEATHKRTDQDLSVGNRGFISGTPTSEPERKPTRQTRVVEMEFGYPFRFESRPPVDKTRDTASSVLSEEATIIEEEGGGVYAEGNKGYLFSNEAPESEARSIGSGGSAGMQEYAVREGDTLQKISMKFYGTTKKWQKIFEANGDRLASPDKIYPGQVIKIPLEGGVKIK